MLRAMRRLLLVLALAACTVTHPPPAVATPAPAKAPAAPPADADVDQGTLRISAKGKPAGDETFRIGKGEIVTRTTLRRGDVEVVVDGKLVLDDKLAPRSGTFTYSGKPGKREQKLERKDGTLQITSEGSPPIVDKGPSDLYVDNLIVSHLAPLCSIAGATEKELKIFPGMRLVVSARTPLQFDTKAGQRALDIIGFQVPGAAVVEVVCDGKKLAMVRQSSVQVVTVRDGYEEIAEILAEADDHKPKIPEGLSEVERTVRSPADGVSLSCSLVTPADRRSPLPAVVLLGAQGPHDRDEDTIGVGGMKTALLKHLAIALAQSGVASLRCDDRGVGQSGGAPLGAVLGVMATDVAAEVKALRAEPGIDGKRVGIAGHAEGATLAQMVAADDATVSALALLSPMGRTLDLVSLDQRDNEMRKLGVKDEVIKDEHKKMATVYAAIRDGKPPPKDTPDETVAALEPVVSYLASHFRLDLPFVVRKVKAKVLITHGERDAMVPASDGKRLRDLYQKSGHKVTFKPYPGLNHVYTPVKRDTADDFADPELAIDMAFVGDVVTFLKASL